jgi:maltooligosyltrehalose trehalohydrolase
MQLLPMDKLGARERKAQPGVIDFGLFLPGITAPEFKIAVRIINEADQFLQSIPAVDFPLAPTADPDFPHGDYWTATVDTTVVPRGRRLVPGTHWAKGERYVFRFVVTTPMGEVIDFIIDPYCRESGVGDLSAISIGYEDHTWSTNEAEWKTPQIQDMIFYELMINEFGGSIEGTIKQLDYLKDLGVGCIEVMPVNNVKNAVNWGYDPIGYFGVDERFGNRRQFQGFVDEAHKRGMAVILDVVYGHTTPEFTFPYLYSRLNTVANPFNGGPMRDNFGPAPDFSLAFTRNYFFTVNHHLLDTLHLDGFRYDNATGFSPHHDDPVPFGALAEATYQLVLAEQATAAPPAPPNYWSRFVDATGHVNLIQCPEYLDNPPNVLRNTFANCTWQDGTLSAATDCALGKPGAIAELGLQLGLFNYPVSATLDGVTIAKTALQYIENHDHLRFLCRFGIVPDDNVLLQEGNRDHWYKVQPYLIGLLMSKGAPFLFEGQEFGENYFVPEGGNGRQLVFRPVRFSYFYDTDGRSLVNKVRRLMKIRNSGEQFKRGEHSFINVDFYNNDGLLVFTRSLGTTFTLVALNFTDFPRPTTIELPMAGSYREEIDGVNNLTAVSPNTPIPVTIPSNYGQAWTID